MPSKTKQAAVKTAEEKAILSGALPQEPAKVGEIIPAVKRPENTKQKQGVSVGLSMRGFAEKCVNDELERLNSRVQMFLFVAKTWPSSFKDFTQDFKRAWLVRLGVGRWNEGEFETLEADKWSDEASAIWRTAGLPSVNVCKAVMYAFEQDLTHSVKVLEGKGTMQQKLKLLPKKRPTPRKAQAEKQAVTAETILATNPDALLGTLRTVPFSHVPGYLLALVQRGEQAGEHDKPLADVCVKVRELLAVYLEAREAERKEKQAEQTGVKAAELLFGHAEAKAA